MLEGYGEICKKKGGLKIRYNLVGNLGYRARQLLHAALNPENYAHRDGRGPYGPAVV